MIACFLGVKPLRGAQYVRMSTEHQKWECLERVSPFCGQLSSDQLGKLGGRLILPVARKPRRMPTRRAVAACYA